MLYIIGCAVAAISVAAYLLSEGDTVSSYGQRRTASNMFLLLFALLSLALTVGGRIACFIGCVCMALKFLGVDPVAGWTWMQTLMPFIGGLVAIVLGIIITEGLKD